MRIESSLASVSYPIVFDASLTMAKRFPIPTSEIFPILYSPSQQQAPEIFSRGPEQKEKE
jgi:hypothetical protein